MTNFTKNHSLPTLQISTTLIPYHPTQPNCHYILYPLEQITQISFQIISQTLMTQTQNIQQNEYNHPQMSTNILLHCEQRD